MKTNITKGGVLSSLVLMLLLTNQGFAKNNQDHRDNNQSQVVEWYGGVGLNMTNAHDEHCEDITYGFIGKLGYDFNGYIGVEGRAIRTNWEYEGAKVKHIGLFAKPMFPINEDFYAYGLLGYGKTSTGHKKVFSDSGLAWGIGLNYYLGDLFGDDNSSRGFGIFVDYERLIEKSNVPDFDSYSIGISYDF